MGPRRHSGLTKTPSRWFDHPFPVSPPTTPGYLTLGLNMRDQFFQYIRTLAQLHGGAAAIDATPGSLFVPLKEEKKAHAIFSRCCMRLDGSPRK